MSAPLAPPTSPVKNPLLTGCMRFLFDQIKMHNHNVVKDEIKPWNDFPPRFLVTQSDPSARSLSELGSRFQPRPEAEEDLARSTPYAPPRHRLSAPAAMFNSSRLHFRKHNIYMRPKTMAEEKLVNHSESHLPPVNFYSFCRSPWKNPTKESLQVLGSFTKSDPQAVNCRPQSCQCLLLCELSRVAIKSSLRWDNTDNYLHILRIREAN